MHAKSDPFQEDSVGQDGGGKRARAAERRSWPIRRFARGEDEPCDNLSDTTTPSERVAMVERLTLDAWAMSAQSIPTYRRDEMPIRVVRQKTPLSPDDEIPD
jgi:hypothetical protein